MSGYVGKSRFLFTAKMKEEKVMQVIYSQPTIKQLNAKEEIKAKDLSE